MTSRDRALRCAEVLRANFPGLLGGRRIEEHKALHQLYGVSRKQAQRLPLTLANQLAACKDEAARRLILGCSR